jgi:hypothetical protein
VSLKEGPIRKKPAPADAGRSQRAEIAMQMSTPACVVGEQGAQSPRQSPHQERNNERRDDNPARQALAPFSILASLMKPLDNFSAPLAQQLFQFAFRRRRRARSHGIGQYVFAE